MPKTEIWNRYGRSISGNRKVTLAAFLGDQQAISNCHKQGVEFPTLPDFEADSSYDPNPHGLNLENGLLQNTQLVLCLMTWGKEPMMGIANALAQYQYNHSKELLADAYLLQNEVAEAVRAYKLAPTSERLEAMRNLSQQCSALYSPYEDDPDSQEATLVWFQLGAPWFAAEAIVGDWALQSYDGEPPGEGQSTWIRRNSVWIDRAADAAAEHTSHQTVHDVMTKSALEWALSS